MKEIFKEIVSGYEGTLYEKDNQLVFTADNVLTTRYQDGRVYKMKCVKCNIYTDGKTLGGEETTYEMIGGFGYPTFTKEDLISVLERYNFKKKKQDN